MSSLAPAISVVLPVYRTGAMAHELWRRLTAALERTGEEFELIFVDDACPEGSGLVVQGLRARDSRVVLVTNERNLGQRATVRRGLAEARGEVIVIMDADLQDEPENIPLLLDELAGGGCEAVFAGRRGEYQAASRMWTSRLFKKLMHWLVDVPSDAGSFVAMTRKMRESVLALRPTRPYMLVLIGSTGLPVRSVAVARASRPEGTSAYSEWARLRFALGGVWSALELRWMKWTA